MSATVVVTRFAPSPTGALHLGNARTALFCCLLARHHGGRFLLRIEDSDPARSSEAHTAALVEDLRWLDLHWEAGPGSTAPPESWRQSTRRAIYDEHLAQLSARGAAYPCFCTPAELEVSRRKQIAAGKPPRYAGTCRDLDAAGRAAASTAGRSPAWRFRVPQGRRLQFEDLVHGPQSIATDDIGDFILQREDGTAAFFFCNALDDALMGVTHVLRGEDHLSNTPRQLLILEALGLQAPRYGHVALLTGADGTPLSKRHGATSLREYREHGYAPLALCNHLFRLGHSCPDNALLTLDEMAERFDPARLQRAPARFDPVQLDHWQSMWVRGADAAATRAWLGPALDAVPVDRQEAFLEAVLPNVIVAEDARFWADVIHGSGVEPDPEAHAAIRRAGPDFFAAAAAAVGETADVAALRSATGAKGAALFAPLRAALTGRLHGPDFAALLRLMSGETVRARLLAHASTGGIRGTHAQDP
jgi:glutamyl-tRNA synthetase